jgi:hypothetical protein
MVERDGYAPAIRMEIMPVSPALTVKDKAIADERVDDDATRSLRALARAH